MRAQTIADNYRKKFGKRIRDVRIRETSERARTHTTRFRITFTVESSSLKQAVAHLAELYPDPHFAVISGCDTGKSVELVYHLSVNYASRLGEVCICIKTVLPKKRLAIPTITDIIPGALVSEREIQEMLGVKVQGIPDPRRIFLHAGFPRNVFPWRKDAKGPAKLVRNLNKGGR